MGYLRNGINFDAAATRVEFVQDPAFRGVLYGEQVVRVFDNFRDPNALRRLQPHLYEDETKEREFIGYHRAGPARVAGEEDSAAWQAPCRQLVLSFVHVLFQDYVFHTSGMVIDEVDS